ncbi:MAG: hypothetical protein HQ591_13290 [candidate division Zixibacteria bacterium]|nr:hypothetical protein [Candidatus Tariuqbacter arcticus]
MRVALLVLNIIGFVFSIPSTLCASACAGLVGAAAKASGQGGGFVGFLAGSGVLIFIICLAAFVLGLVAYSKPKTTLAMIAGILLIIAGLIQLAFILMGGFIGLIAGICFILAGIFAFTAKPATA